MKKPIVLVALFLVTAGAFGQSTFGTGQWLHDGWQASQKMTTNLDRSDLEAGGEYMGFVLGTTRMMAAIEWLDVPATSTLGQWLDVVGKYLDDHPEDWNLRAEFLVYRALVAVWPGKKKPPN